MTMGGGEPRNLEHLEPIYNSCISILFHSWSVYHTITIPRCEPWCWNIYLHLPRKWPIHAGKYSSTMVRIWVLLIYGYVFTPNSKGLYWSFFIRPIFLGHLVDGIPVTDPHLFFTHFWTLLDSHYDHHHSPFPSRWNHHFHSEKLSISHIRILPHESQHKKSPHFPEYRPFVGILKAIWPYHPRLTIYWPSISKPATDRRKAPTEPRKLRRFALHRTVRVAIPGEERNDLPRG